jgi:membrane fusion protein, copper/silver efflux system
MKSDPKKQDLRKRVLGVGVAALAVFGFALGRITVPTTAQADTPSLRVPATGSRPSVGQDLNVVLPGTVAPRITGVRVEPVRHQTGTRRLHAKGTIEEDDSRIYRVFAGSEGRISSLGNNSPGTFVHKNEKLATFFSNELIKAQQAYFFSLQAFESAKAGNRPNDIRQAEDGVRAHEKILMSMGMGEPQIRQVAKKREATRDIEIVSPGDGIVVARNLVQLQRLEPGRELFRIIDLSHIWILASVLPGELPVLDPGTKAKIVVPQTGKRLDAVVSSAVPLVDSEGRVLQLKLEAQNRGLLLRPDMYVDIELQIPAPPGLSVTREAVIDDGIEKIVYLETRNHTFEPRAVELGSTFGDRVLIRRGLSEGDLVAVPGHFLRDSESRTRKELLLTAARASN